MAIPEKQRLYGQVLVDFANAASTDEAGLKYFENIQKAFDLPYSFIDKAKNNFPTLKDFYSPLTKQEIKYLEQISEIKTLENEIASTLCVDSLKYDAYSKTFHIDVYQEIELGDGTLAKDPSIERISRDVSIEELEEMIRRRVVEPIFQDHIEDTLSTSLPKLMRLKNRITEEKEISDEKYQELYLLQDTFADIREEHNYIEFTQENLKSFIKDILKTPAPINIEVIQDKLKSFIKDVLTPPVPINTELFSKASLEEAYFTDRSDLSFLFLFRVYNYPIAYCSKEFFNVKNNIEHLKKCELCKKFYIANKQIKEQRRCSICSKKTRATPEKNREYQRNFRQRLKDDEKKRTEKRESRIKEHRVAEFNSKTAKGY